MLCEGAYSAANSVISQHDGYNFGQIQTQRTLRLYSVSEQFQFVCRCVNYCVLELGPFLRPNVATTLTNLRLYCRRRLARPVFFFFFSCLSTCVHVTSTHGTITMQSCATTTISTSDQMRFHTELSLRGREIIISII